MQWFIVDTTDKKERQRAAGRWLRHVRQRRYPTVKSMAEALGIDPSVMSRMENGEWAVDDERAEQIAEVLDMDIITARRGLGLWVPADAEPEPEPEETAQEKLDRLLHEVSLTLEEIQRLRSEQATAEEQRRTGSD